MAVEAIFESVDVDDDRKSGLLIELGDITNFDKFPHKSFANCLLYAVKGHIDYFHIDFAYAKFRHEYGESRYHKSVIQQVYGLIALAMYQRPELSFGLQCHNDGLEIAKSWRSVLPWKTVVPFIKENEYYIDSMLGKRLYAIYLIASRKAPQNIKKILADKIIGKDLIMFSFADQNISYEHDFLQLFPKNPHRQETLMTMIKKAW